MIDETNLQLARPKDQPPHFKSILINLDIHVYSKTIFIVMCTTLQLKYPDQTSPLDESRMCYRDES